MTSLTSGIYIHIQTDFQNRKRFTDIEKNTYGYKKGNRSKGKNNLGVWD